ncbi:MAG: FixH family protein [Sphingomonas sp.]|nr:FixH family protein [Sphingomonas sp.]
MTRPFTGWHMLAIMVAFFGVIIAVNFTMARFAIGTFGGVVVDNSYVASQRFNGWLAEARAQDKLGWRVVPGIDSTGRLQIAATDAQGALIGGQMTVTARHPLGRLPDRTIAMRATPTGFIADAPLPAGRWKLRIELNSNGQSARFEQDVKA